MELFQGVGPVAPSPLLRMALTEWGPLALAINSEKARSEFIIAPVLAELRRLPAVSLFSGINFDVDPERGLNGYCDFLLSRSAQQLFIEAPVFAIVEAKNEDIKSGFGQCIASMVGAQLFNDGLSTAVKNFGTRFIAFWEFSRRLSPRNKRAGSQIRVNNSGTRVPKPG